MNLLYQLGSQFKITWSRWNLFQNLLIQFYQLLFGIHCCSITMLELLLLFLIWFQVSFYHVFFVLNFQINHQFYWHVLKHTCHMFPIQVYWDQKVSLILIIEINFFRGWHSWTVQKCHPKKFPSGRHQEVVRSCWECEEDMEGSNE